MSRTNPKHRRLVLGGLVGVLLLASCSIKQDDYVAKNEALLAGTAPYPGAMLLSTESDSYELGDTGIGGPDGYLTRMIWSVAEPTEPADVLDFYQSELGSEWTLVLDAGCFSDCPPTADEGPTARFERGSESIAVLFYGGAAGGYEIVLDHDS